MSIRPSDDLQADIAELESLIAMTTRPNILQTLEKLRNSLHEQQQQNMSPSIRTPIQRSKAKAHTVYITTGYGWCQTKETVIIYLTVKNASKLSPGQYTMDVQRRSIQLDIMEHEGANYNFRISQLNGQVIPEKTKIKLKDSKLIIYLYKENHGREWNDIRLKTTRDVYDELQRAEGKEDTTTIYPSDEYGPVLHGLDQYRDAFHATFNPFDLNTASKSSHCHQHQKQ